MSSPTPEPADAHATPPAPPTRGDGACLSLRVVTMPRDTNPYGTIFGGVILSYIDQASAVEALRNRNCTWVTASIERVDFLAPVYLGDAIELWTTTTRTGRTSVTVATEVQVRRRDTGLYERVTNATATMVALGADGKPTPYEEAPPPRIFGVQAFRELADRQD